MRDPYRELWESDPLRPMVQSNAWNLAFWIWSLGWPIVILSLALFGILPRNWKGLTGLMMLAFASGQFVQILGWIYERIKYRDR
jgi:hypothetical protein